MRSCWPPASSIAYPKRKYSDAHSGITAIRRLRAILVSIPVDTGGGIGGNAHRRLAGGRGDIPAARKPIIKSGQPSQVIRIPKELFPSVVPLLDLSKTKSTSLPPFIANRFQQDFHKLYLTEGLHPRCSGGFVFQQPIWGVVSCWTNFLLKVTPFESGGYKKLLYFVKLVLDHLNILGILAPCRVMQEYSLSLILSQGLRK